MELKTFNGNSYTSKTTSLYWMSPQVTVPIITSKGNNWIMSLSTYIDSGYWGQHGYLIFKWVEWLDFQMFFLEWNVYISNQISLKFVLKDQIDNVSSSVQAMASTPLFEPMMTHLTDTHCWTSAVFFLKLCPATGIILCMGSAKERRRYNVIPHWLSPYTEWSLSMPI